MFNLEKVCRHLEESSFTVDLFLLVHIELIVKAIISKFSVDELIIIIISYG